MEQIIVLDDFQMKKTQITSSMFNILKGITKSILYKIAIKIVLK